MREQIKVYVNGLFKDAALTIRNAEVQQEILQHTLDRYDDLIAAGKSEQEAYDEAVGGIGDVSELYEHKQAAEKPKSGIFLRRLHRTRYPLRRRPAGRKSSPAGPSRLSVWVWQRRFWR